MHIDSVRQSLSHDATRLHRNQYIHGISVLSAEEKGFGLFAAERIQSNLLICSNLAKPLSKLVDCSDMRLFQYLFSAPEEHQSESYVIVCGEMVFLNHCDEPTARVEWRRERSGLLFADLFSIRKIEQGSEITIKYKDIDRYQSEQLI